jgi:hypothetical protein
MSNKVCIARVRFFSEHALNVHYWSTCFFPNRGFSEVLSIVVITSPLFCELKTFFTIPLFFKQDYNPPFTCIFILNLIRTATWRYVITEFLWRMTYKTHWVGPKLHKCTVYIGICFRYLQTLQTHPLFPLGGMYATTTYGKLMHSLNYKPISLFF